MEMYKIETVVYVKLYINHRVDVLMIHKSLLIEIEILQNQTSIKITTPFSSPQTYIYINKIRS